LVAFLAFTVSSVAESQLNWTYKFGAATNKTLSGWDTWILHNGKVTQESSAEFLKISASTAAYNIRRQFDLNSETGYTAVFKLAVEVQGQPGNPNNAMVSIGDVQLYWVAPVSPATSDGTLFVKLSGGALPVARLGKTDDGVHIYWIARQGNKLRLWVDDLSDASAVEFYVTSDASKQRFMLSDDNGSSGKSKFQLYWLFCSEAGEITPQNGELSGIDMSLAFDEAFGKPLVWTPWPLQGKFVLGAWEIFQEGAHNGNVKSMELYKDAGFNMCTAVDKKAVDIGRKLGLHMLVAAQWGWRQRKDYFEGWVELAESYPDVGYLTWDEPEEEHFELLKDRLKILNQRDPSRLAWVNMLPYSSWGGVYKSRVDKFIAMSHPRVISYDCYPLHLGGDEYVAYYRNMEIFRELAADYGIPWWAYVQVFGADAIGLRDPNESEIRWQVYSLLTYGSKGILYFLYSPFRGGSDGMIDKEGNPTEKYYCVQQLNSEINSMADVLMKVQSTAVMHIGRKKAYVKMFSPTSLVKQADAANAILGVFIDPKTGKQYIMVTNKDHGTEVDVNGTPQIITLTLGNDVKSITRIGTSKPDISWSFNDQQHLLQLTIPPATGALFEVNR